MKFILLIFFSSISFACEFIGASTIVSINKDTSSLFRSNNCNKLQISAFNEIMEEADGLLTSKYIQMAPELKNARLIPESVTITSFNRLLQERITLNQKQKIVLSSKIYNKNLLRLEKESRLEVECQNCTSPGVHSVKVTKYSKDDKIVSWLKVSVLEQVRAFVARQDMTVDYEDLNPSFFSKEIIYTTNASELVQKKSDILFVRLNRNIFKGSPLKKTQISKVQLIKPGIPVKVEMNYKGLKMKSFATPLQSGFMGELIRLRNVKNNKVFMGKIVGKNKVKVSI